MNDQPKRLLLIEDNPGDARLIHHFLNTKENAAVDLRHAGTLDEGLARLAAASIDAILLDLHLPDSQGIDTFARLHARVPHVPIIVLTGSNDETLANQAVAAGAQDYLIKDEINATLLGRALNYAIERQRLRLAAQNHARALTMLSECNQALAYESNEQALLDRICHILVFTGGYRRAWIDFGENNTTPQNGSVAFAGYLEGELAAIHADKCPNLEQERHEAESILQAHRELPTLTAFPLTLFGRARGVLVLQQAAGQAAPDEQESKLLAEMVADLTYGLETLRTRAERRQAERRTLAFAALGRDLNAATTAEEAGRLIVKVADDLIGWDASIFALYNAETDLLKPILTIDTIEEQRIDVPPAYSGKPLLIARRVLGQGGFLLLRELTEQPAAGFIPFGDTGRPSASLLYVPIRDRASVTGYLSIQSYTYQAYTQEDLITLQALADHCGGALNRIATTLENSRLFEETRQRARQVQQIIDTVPEGVLLLNQDHQLILANPTAETYLAGLATRRNGHLTHLGGRPIANFLPPDPTAISQHELTGPHNQRLFRVTARLMGNQATPEGWVFILRDITEERKQQEYTQAQERLAVVGQLAAGIAHDFNNIMAVVVLDVSLMLKTPGLSEKNHERLHTIHEQAQRASHLIRQILDFSRRSVLERSSLDFLVLLKELSKLLRRTLPESVTLTLNWQDHDYLVNGDPARLQQIVMNLAVNARDAMVNGGTLRLDLDKFILQPDQPPPLPDVTPGEWLVLTVTDNGSGIPPQHLPHIFEPFFTTKPPGQGTGLGLAQVYGVVKQHEGYIGVSSQPGQGTTFTIYLPTLPVNRPVHNRLDAGLLLHGKGETILVVEDEEKVRQALAEVLEMLSYQVLTAENGQQALALFEQQGDQIDLVLSDIVMPTMGGTALLAQLKARKADVKMILMTGYPLKEGASSVTGQGIVGWLQKPVEVAQLAAALRRAILTG